MKNFFKFALLLLTLTCHQAYSTGQSQEPSIDKEDIFSQAFESPRLRFYPMGVRFYGDIATMWQDPKVIQNWESGAVIDAVKIPPRMQRYEKREREKAIGWRAIVTKQGEDFVGVVGALHEGDGLVQICYCIRSQYHRQANSAIKGYGEEAVKGLLFYVMNGLPAAANIYAPIKASNVPSIGLVTTKLGMQAWEPTAEVKKNHPERLFYSAQVQALQYITNSSWNVIYQTLASIASSSTKALTASSTDKGSADQSLTQVSTSLTQVLKENMLMLIVDWTADFKIVLANTK